MAITSSYQLQTVLPEFTANGWVMDNQFGSEVVGLSNGGFAVVYGTALSGDFFPLVRFFDSNFTPLSAYTIPYADSNNDMQGDPEIVELSNGNVAVVWDEGAGGNNQVLGAIINPNTGAVVAPQFTVSSFAVDGDPEATALAGGNWVVAMTSGSTIYLQIFDSNGNMVGSQVATGAGTDTDPVITALTGGGFVVAYTVNDGTTGENAVYATIFNDAGGVVVAPFEIGFNAVGDNNHQPAIAALPNGNWAIVYTDSGGSGSGVSLHIFSPTGTDLTGAIRIDTVASTIEQDPDLTVLANGFIVVSWTYPFAVGDNDIHAVVYDQNGAPVTVSGSNTVTITGSVTDDTDASISTILDGRFVSSWTDTNPDANGDDSISAEVDEIVQVVTSDAAGDTFVGSALQDVMNGYGGNDTFYGLAGNDTLSGGDGNDTLSGGVGDDQVDGGVGADWLYGGDGDDFIEGLGEDDVLSGGNNNDELYGGVGNDTVYGGGGTDLLNGFNGVDTMAGGAGNDSLAGGDQGDFLYGQDGFDTMSGSNGNDLLSGGNDGDSLYGGANADQLIGGAGVDYLDGGTGTDTLTGGLGNDFYVFSVAWQHDTIQGFENNIDTIDLDDALWGGVPMTVAQVLAAYATQISPGIVDLDFGGGDILTVVNGAGITVAQLQDDITIV